MTYRLACVRVDIDESTLPSLAHSRLEKGQVAQSGSV